MADDCIFCKIVAGQIPSDKVYEDDSALVFKDIHPAAPVHLIIVPKKHIANVNDAEPANQELFGRLFHAAKMAAEKAGVDKSGYRCVINTNKDADQVIFHLHIHLLGGRALTWPPG